MVLKIDYVTENASSKLRHKFFFYFKAPPLEKSWLRSCVGFEKVIANGMKWTFHED